jgi:hypothetical protein
LGKEKLSLVFASMCPVLLICSDVV